MLEGDDVIGDQDCVISERGGGDGDGGASFGGDGLVVSFMIFGIKEMRSCELFGFSVE